MGKYTVDTVAISVTGEPTFLATGFAARSLWFAGDVYSKAGVVPLHLHPFAEKYCLTRASPCCSKGLMFSCGTTYGGIDSVVWKYIDPRTLVTGCLGKFDAVSLRLLCAMLRLCP